MVTQLFLAVTDPIPAAEGPAEAVRWVRGHPKGVRITDRPETVTVTELTAIGREEWPAITMIVFRNYQWGAEKRNSTLWFDDNFVGTELDEHVSYAGIAQACGLLGVQARTMDELSAALSEAVDNQMNHGRTTLIEAMINQELGEPFRRDAMKQPVVVAGIDPADMRPQAGAV